MACQLVCEADPWWCRSSVEADSHKSWIFEVKADLSPGHQASFNMLPQLLRGLRPLVPKAQYVRALSQFTTIDAEEVKKFSAKSQEWWDPHGEFGMLHLMNPTRVSYIRDRVTPGNQGSAPFAGLKMLDIGCGGGLLSEVCHSFLYTQSRLSGTDSNLTVFGSIGRNSPRSRCFR